MAQTRRQAEIELWERIEVEDELRRKRYEKKLKDLKGDIEFIEFLVMAALIAIIITVAVVLLIKFL